MFQADENSSTNEDVRQAKRYCSDGVSRETASKVTTKAERSVGLHARYQPTSGTLKRRRRDTMAAMEVSKAARPFRPLIGCLTGHMAKSRLMAFQTSAPMAERLHG